MSIKDTIERKARELYPVHTYTVFTDRNGNYNPAVQPDLNKEARDKAIQLAEFIAGQMFGEELKPVKAYQECATEVARRHNLGNALVTGHKAGYFEEAAKEYASQFTQYKADRFSAKVKPME